MKALFSYKKGVTYMDQNLLNIGFGNTVVAERVVAIVSPNSAPHEAS